MEIEQKQINKIQFDKATKLKIQTYLDEINQKQQQQKLPYNKTKYIKFASDHLTESASSCTLQTNLIRSTRNRLSDR
jgi:hypothetical protein